MQVNQVKWNTKNIIKYLCENPTIKTVYLTRQAKSIWLEEWNEIIKDKCLQGVAFTNIFVSKNFQVKELIVNPGAILSLQKHKYRSENWVVVEGKANVTLNKKNISLNKSDSIFIPQGAVHRIENRQKSVLKIIEVQTGSYLGEDDIIRIKDIYGRA